MYLYEYVCVRFIVSPEKTPRRLTRFPGVLVFLQSSIATSLSASLHSIRACIHTHIHRYTHKSVCVRAVESKEKMSAQYADHDSLRSIRNYFYCGFLDEVKEEGKSLTRANSDLKVCMPD